MFMGIEIVNELPEDEWRTFVDNHPAGNIFHTPEMFHVYSHTKGYRPELWAAIQDEQILSLILPVQINLGGGILRSFTTRAVVYGGLLHVPSIQGREAVEMLLQNYTCKVNGSPLYTEIRNTVDISDIQPILSKYGFNVEEHLNYLIDLDRSEQTIWSALSKKTRQHVRKARKSGLTLEDVQDQHELNIYYQLLQQVYNRVHVPLADISLFKSAFDILLSRGMVKAFRVRSDKKCIGFNAFLLYKRRIFDWFRGSDRSFSSFQPESLMIWQILKWGRENNFQIFDFGGAGRPDQDYGPRIFKSRWGGSLVNYGRSTYIHAPNKLKLSKIGYQLLRKYI